MPSPFPGMNPFLEQPRFWRDFHQSFAIYIRDALVPLVRPNYYVRIEERLYVSEWPHEEKQSLVGLSDLSLHNPIRESFDSTHATTLVAPLQVVVDIQNMETGLNSVEICDRNGDEIVTVIEILSPSNKFAGDDRAAYLEKRAEILRTKANLVELDLLRGGPKLPSRGMTKCDYHILVSRASNRPQAAVWPFQLKDPFPRFLVPLRPTEEPVELNLKPILDRLYDNADYARFLYRSPPVPPLSSEEMEWAKGILTESHRT